ncbi:MAG: hypothetical protein HDR88_02405 [Bacteroides sp.]|nr:hypothetical protein [Bacteroides sp.]
MRDKQQQMRDKQQQMRDKQQQMRDKQQQMRDKQQQMRDKMAKSHEKILKKSQQIREKAVKQRQVRYRSRNGINDVLVNLNLIPKTVYTGNVERITASENAVIVYQQGEAGKVEILSDNTPHADMDISVENGMLYVSTHEINNNSQHKVVVRVTSPSLSEVTLGGASSFSVNGAISIPDILLVNTSGASEINFGEIRGNILDIRSEEASSVYVLTAELETLKASATSASIMRLKGLNVENIIADASSAAEIILGGRCDALSVEEEFADMVNSKGLIVQSVYSSKDKPTERVVPKAI